MPKRIALFGIYHESNTFIEKPTTIEDFINGHWLKGTALLEEYRYAYHEIGGMITTLDRQDIQLIPVSFAEATPGGVISAEAYGLLLQQLLQDLSVELPVDGCIVALHGAAVSENYRDMDGHWLRAVRNLVGEHVPIVATIDPHANVSHEMVSVTNAMYSYQTNPHLDQKETGIKAAEMLLRIIFGKANPYQYLVTSPVVISIEQQYTGANPCLALYMHVEKMILAEDLYHISINLGFPYADVMEMGTSFVVIAKTKAGQQNIQRQLDTYMKIYCNEFAGSRKTIDELLPDIRKSNKPVLLLDMGDNVGGGATGTSLYLLRVFEENERLYRSLFCLYAPQAVVKVSDNVPGEWVTLHLDDEEGESLHISAQIRSVCDGKFSETIPRHGGQANYDMGRVAIVQTINGSTILLMSLRVPPFSLKQITTFKIQPGDFDVIIAKGVIAPIAAYGPVCKTIFQVDTPGKTQANMLRFAYKNRRKPLYPFEPIEKEFGG